MRGRAAILVVLPVLLLSLPAFSQCNYSLVASVPFRSTAYDVTIDGNDLWLASGYGVALYDRSVDPPVLSSEVAVPQTTRLVRAANGTAYAAGGASVAVIVKNGKQLQLVSSFTAPGTVNDLLLTTNDLYVATSNGLAQYDLLDKNHPARTLATFTTSNANVTSLALAGLILYAADGDSSIASFDLNVPQSPQKRSNLTSLARATTLHVINNRLYVSDGLQSEVFLQAGATPVSAAVVAVPTTTAAQVTSDALFAGGNDRRVRAFDFAIAGSPVEIFRGDTPISLGNVNRASGMAGGSGRLYIAAGDGGLVTYDISGFSSPFALRSYSGSAPSSVVSVGDHIYTTPASGGIVEFIQSASGALSQGRTWDATNADTVRDGAAGFLLSTSGANATLWTLNSTIPVSISGTTFAAPVSAAVLSGTTAVALLTDGTVATADMSNQNATPQKVAIVNTAKVSAMARSDNAVVFAQPSADGATTSLFYFASIAQLTATATPTATAQVNGTAIGGIALGGPTAAVFTFAGINIVDFSVSPPASRALAKSNASAPLQLGYSGPSLLELTLTELIVWSTAGSGSITARYTLPSSGTSLATSSGSTIADVATSAGVSSIALTSSSRLPSVFATANGNEFYKRVAAGGGRVYLSTTSVDIFTNAMTWIGRAGSGIVDLAASDKGFFTVNGSAVVTAWSPDGVALKSVQVATGSDIQPLAIFVAGNAVWVSVSRGCLTTGCEKVTFVLDPVTLAQSDQLTGGVTDVATVGTRAYALTDLPAETRVYDITNPAHPVQTAARAITDTPAPVAIAGDANNVFTVGTTLATLTAGSLSPVATQLDSFAGVAGANAFGDQRLRGQGPCILVAGRNANAIFGTSNPAAWTSALTIDAPSFVRSAAYVNGTFYLLTDDSLEVYSTSALPKAPRRHIAH
jgi:hypothetical protein